jgi:hypothetical protein
MALIPTLSLTYGITPFLKHDRLRDFLPTLGADRQGPQDTATTLALHLIQDGVFTIPTTAIAVISGDHCSLLWGYG